MAKHIERISLGLGGVEANGISQHAVMTSNGRYVVFESEASNLVEGDTNGVSDIFRYDTVTGEIVRVSVGGDTQLKIQSNGASTNATVSADGRYVAFETTANNLSTDDTNGLRDIYLWDSVTGVSTRVSSPLGGEATGGAYGSYSPVLLTSGSAVFVGFVSDASNLTPNDTNDLPDTFIVSATTGEVFLISRTESGAPSQGYSGPYLSMGLFGQVLVVFSSQDPTLTSDTPVYDAGPAPAFPGYPPTTSTQGFNLYITDGETTTLVSLGEGGSTAALGHNFEASIVFPYISYTSTASNVSGGVDTNGFTDIYVYDIIRKTSTLVTVGLNGEAANGDSGSFSRVSVDDYNLPWVTFSSAASNLVEGDTNGKVDFFVWNLVTQEIIMISDPGNGVVANGNSYGFAPGGDNFSSTTQTYVFFSDASNLVAGDTNGFTDLFRMVMDRKNAVVAASSGHTTITEQTAGVIDAGLTLTDVDTARPTQATVKITGGYIKGQDVLQFEAINGVTGVFDANTGTLTLTGWANMAAYQAALRTVKFLNTSDAPVGSRTIGFAVNDGVGWSAISSKTIDLLPVNDRPTTINLAGSTVLENRAAGSVVGTLSTIDPDNGGTFTYELVDNAGGRFVIDGNKIKVADGTLLDFEQKASHQVQVKVTDEGGLTRTRTFTITVTDVINETATGNDQSNTLVGGSGNDKLLGLGGSDILVGNAGNDILDGGADSVLDVLIGGAGNDTYVLGASSNDIVVEYDGNGTDTATSTISRALNGQLASVENLTLLGTAAINGTGNGSVNIITGNEAANVLDGVALGDTLSGNGGNDVFLYASQTNFTGDRVNGGAGIDRIRFTATTANETLTLSNKVTLVEVAEISSAAGSISGKTALNLNASAVTSGLQLIGNNGANIITGTGFADTITGNAGNDTLRANAGDDKIFGGLGNDTLSGGAGRDSFYFNTALNKSSNVDAITDFVVVDDTIRLDKAIFAALSVGMLTPGAFAKNLTGVATQADDRIIYETDTGKLFYDANGVGGAAGVHFATVGPNLLLTNVDFVVY